MGERRANAFRRWLTAAAVWIASWWLRGTPFAVSRIVSLKTVAHGLVGLHRLTYTSGHLTRAYHAGRAVRQGVETALDELLAAQGMRGAYFKDTYAAPLTRKLYLQELPRVS